MAIRFVHVRDGWIADQAHGNFSAIQSELFAHASEECFEWRPGDTYGSLAVQGHFQGNINKALWKTRLEISSGSGNFFWLRFPRVVGARLGLPVSNVCGTLRL